MISKLPDGGICALQITKEELIYQLTSTS
ncbi:MAG: hypothetical protein JWO80_64, partial [Bryobacterales bacterium]|nr:hypothetical protein [Bryobacterales bacterium]